MPKASVSRKPSAWAGPPTLPLLLVMSELDGRTFLLVTLQALAAEIGEIKLGLSWNPLPCWPALLPEKLPPTISLACTPREHAHTAR